MMVGMIPSVDPALLSFAVEIVREAGDYTLGLFQSATLDITHKADGSKVTQADHRAEHMLRDRIMEAFPADAIQGEEHEDHAGTSGRHWVIDPIDGTESFARGVGLYANLLFLEDEHGPALGVINIPALHEIVWAGRGLGAWFNGVECRVSDQTGLEGAALSTSGFECWEPEVLERARQSGMLLRTWGDGYGYVLVATGRIDAMVDPAVNYWDVAPCQVIIAEAGGRLTALDGSTNIHSGNAIATNGHLHDAVLDALAGR